MVSTQKQVVCPKCKAKLKFDPQKITSEFVRCKCPGCKTVLRIKKPVSNEQSAETREDKAVRAVDAIPIKAGKELLNLAKKFEEEMGFDVDRQDDSVDETDVIEPAAESSEETAPEPVEEIRIDTSKGSDARKTKRVKFKKKVLVNNQIMVEALDISENGLFLHTGRSFEDGSTVEVGIPTLPGNFDLVVQARVQHNHRGIGMGMQFLELDAKQKTRLQKLINELDNAAAEDHEGRKKILLVGGTDTARNINKSKLVLDGFYVMQATTANEVFQTLNNEPPDAIVLEWQEEKFHCKGLLAQINKNPQFDVIIKVVLSALTDSFVQREIMDAGAHRYMAKMDTNPARLSLVLKQLVEERDG